MQKSKYRLSPLAKKAATYLTPALAIGFVLVFPHHASAAVMDNMGNYLYNGVTGPLVKGVSTGCLVGSFYGMRQAEGQAHSVLVKGAVSSGGVLGAPVLITEAQHFIAGFISVPFLSHMTAFASSLAHVGSMLRF